MKDQTEELIKETAKRMFFAEGKFHATTQEIADEAKGLFIGTSLNGIGRRYALIDNIADRDTKEILSRFNRTP